MKKLLIMILAVMLVFTACVKKNEKKEADEVKNTNVTEQKQEENVKTESKEAEPEKEETKKTEAETTADSAEENAPSKEQPAESTETQNEAVEIDGEGLENLLGDYEQAKEDGNEEAERAALDEIQKILEQVEAQSAE